MFMAVYLNKLKIMADVRNIRQRKRIVNGKIRWQGIGKYFE